MKRFLTVSALALLGLSACESGELTSPLEPESLNPSFAKPALLLFEPPEECPAEHCLFGPVTLLRERGAPTVLEETFEGVEGQEATLVVLAADPRTTTVKGWLNGEEVLLPSALPRSGSAEVRVPIILQEENVLRIRLSGKPGSQVAVWVETEEVPPVDPPAPPPPAMVFELTGTVWSYEDDLSTACSPFGDEFVVADWNDIVQAVNEGFAKEDILASGLALILRDGQGIIPMPLPPSPHYMVSADGPDTHTEASVGPDLLWLTSGTSFQPVLCKGPWSAP